MPNSRSTASSPTIGMVRRGRGRDFASPTLELPTPTLDSLSQQIELAEKAEASRDQELKEIREERQQLVQQRLLRQQQQQQQAVVQQQQQQAVVQQQQQQQPPPSTVSPAASRSP